MTHSNSSDAPWRIHAIDYCSKEIILTARHQRSKELVRLPLAVWQHDLAWEQGFIKKDLRLIKKTIGYHKNATIMNCFAD